MVFRSQSVSITIITVFFKSFTFCWTRYEIFIEDGFIRKKCSFLSLCCNLKNEWSRNWTFRTGIILRRYFLILGISIDYFPRWCYHHEFECQLDSVAVTVDYLPVRFFGNIWFVALILFQCCSPKRSFSAWVCSNEKTSEKCCCKSADSFCTCSVNFSEKEGSGLWSWFCCVFSVGFVFGSTGNCYSRDSVLFSVWLLLSSFSFPDGIFECQLPILFLLDMNSS